ncbi:inverse autotransporter beta domain-containing protein [Botrimarina sp.]|uniref:inverse autotransporter beta domain-containing protein n=1 Tax=Botrimarina sp. TaxID=2795802 RepID=UPI0032EBC660
MPRWLTAAVTLATLGGAALAEAQLAAYGPYYELEVRGGGVTDDGQVNFFFPLRQDGQSLLFADVRAQLDDRSGAQGTWGVAYRRLLDIGWIAGVNSYYDLRHTTANQQFSQFGAGFEALNLTQGFRGNLYLPEEGAKTTDPGDAPASAIFLDDNIFISRPREVAFRGFDLEAEQLLWWSGLTGPEAPAGQPTPDVAWWASAGGFHYTPTVGELSDLTGPRVRTEARVYDLPMLGHDSRLVFGAQIEHDDVRGTTGTATITVRMAIGRPPERGRRLTWIEQRMVAPVVRDRRVVTDLIRGAAGELEPAINARIDRLITGARIIDAANPTPEAEIAAAGADSVVIVDGSSGEIVLPSTTLALGQVLMGGRSGLLVRGAETGATAVFAAPGTRPTIDLGGGGLTLADDSTLIGLGIEGENAASSPLLVASDVDDVLLRDVNVAASDTAIPLAITGDSSIAADGVSSFSGETVAVTVSDTSLLSMNNSGASAPVSALVLEDQAAALVQNGSRLASNVVTVQLNDDSTAVISGSQVLVAQSGPTIAPIAIVASDTSDLALINTQVSAVDPSNGALQGGRGILFAGETLTLSGGQVQSTDVALQIAPGPTSTATLLVQNASLATLEAPTISYVGASGSTATINATIRNNQVSSGVFRELSLDTDASDDTVNLNFAGNSLSGGNGTAVLIGDINVTQSAPGDGAQAIDAVNNLPELAIEESPSVEFDQLEPPEPSLP